MVDKPHKGSVTQWRKHYLNSMTHQLSHPIYGPNLGYYISGWCQNHPDFGNNPAFSSSLIVKHDEQTGEIETLNSRYTLLGGEIGPEKH